MLNPTFLLSCLPFVLAQDPRGQTLDAYVKDQTRVALSGIVANTFGVSSQYPGVIIASPAQDTAPAGETGGQNYFFQWTRDAALTVKILINQFASGDSSLEPLLRAYVENESNIQHLQTLSGNFTTGGLGEPKYYVNSTAFNGEWGRPQRDGPALRAISIMGFLSLINDTSYIKRITSDVIKPDLDYVANSWNQTGFDLWEEQNSLHFFTANAQGRALREGAAFMAAAGYNDSAKAYLAQEAGIASLVESFWNASTNTFDAHADLTKPTGADCANLLSSIHGSDGGAKFTPSSSKILASADTLITEFTGLYPIDSQHNLSAISVGRYASDVYDGIQSSNGNPWYLCNSAVAETLYLAATEFESAGIISIDEINTKFFKRILPTSVSGTNLTGTSMTTVLSGIRKYADDFLAIEQLHVGANYSMAEEFNRTTGVQQGARDLTWSYAAFVSASRARDGQLTYDFTQGHAANLQNVSTSTTNVSTLGTPSQAKVQSAANPKFTSARGLICLFTIVTLVSLM